MRHRFEVGEQGGPVEYEWRTGAKWNRLSVRATGAPSLATPGSEAEFITEHYWGYAGHPGRPTTEYEVEHPRWRIWPVADHALDLEVRAVYGDEFVAPLSARPSSAFLAEGSPIVVRRGARLV
jgi:uncharacterized protein